MTIRSANARAAVPLYPGPSPKYTVNYTVQNRQWALSLCPSLVYDECVKKAPKIYIGASKHEWSNRSARGRFSGITHLFRVLPGWKAWNGGPKSDQWKIAESILYTYTIGTWQPLPVRLAINWRHYVIVRPNMQYLQLGLLHTVLGYNLTSTHGYLWSMDYICHSIRSNRKMFNPSANFWIKALPVCGVHRAPPIQADDWPLDHISV